MIETNPTLAISHHSRLHKSAPASAVPCAHPATHHLELPIDCCVAPLEQQLCSPNRQRGSHPCQPPPHPPLQHYPHRTPLPQPALPGPGRASRSRMAAASAALSGCCLSRCACLLAVSSFFCCSTCCAANVAFSSGVIADTLVKYLSMLQRQ